MDWLYLNLHNNPKDYWSILNETKEKTKISDERRKTMTRLQDALFKIGASISLGIALWLFLTMIGVFKFT